MVGLYQFSCGPGFRFNVFARYFSSNTFLMKRLFLFAAPFLLVGVVFLACLRNYINTETEYCVTIVDKERSSKSGAYYIYTEKDVFTIKDEWFRFNFRSSDWYGLVQEGKCYRFKTGGFRNGLLSIYKNIHSKPIECEECK